MYFEYCLYAAPVILGTGAVAWVWMRLSGRSSRTGNRFLVSGTFSALAAALAIPLIARLLYRWASLSMPASVALAFALCSIAIGFGFLLFKAVTALIGARTTASSADNIPPAGMYDALAGAAPASVETEADIGILTEKNVDTGRNTDRIGIEASPTDEEKIKNLLENAIALKMAGRLAEAADNYSEILSLIDDKDFAAQIIIELCGILKKLNNTRVIRDILDSERGNLLNDDIKAGILNNI